MLLQRLQDLVLEQRIQLLVTHILRQSNYCYIGITLKMDNNRRKEKAMQTTWHENLLRRLQGCQQSGWGHRIWDQQRTNGGEVVGDALSYVCGALSNLNINFMKKLFH